MWAAVRALLCASVLGLSSWAATPAGAQVRGDSVGTLGSLLEQLNSLQRLGALDRVGGTVRSPVDLARQQSDPQGDQSQTLQAERLRAGEALEREISEVTHTERIVLRRFCAGELGPELVRQIELIRGFSPLERDYCLRSGDLMLQFGYDSFWRQGVQNQLSVGAVPPDYVLGVGDELIVNFHGKTSITYTLRVDREGRAVVPDFPPIAAAGRSFTEFRRELEARTQASKIATSVFVSLGAVRATQIVVAGEVRRPGVHLLTGLSSIIDALALAGGPKKTGSLRRIAVQRDDQTFWFDGYDILYSGPLPVDLTLRDRDRIIVPPLGPTAGIAGDVRRAGIYEMAEGKRTLTIAELLRLAGGPLRPRGNKFMHITFDTTGRERLVERTDENAPVQDGEVILVQRRDDLQVGAVELVGHVRVPGRRSLAAAGTLAALIGDVSQLKANPYLLFAALETTDPPTRARRLFPVNLQSVIDGRQNYQLADGDRLIVLGADDVRFLSSTEVQRLIGRRLEFDTRRDVDEPQRGPQALTRGERAAGEHPERARRDDTQATLSQELPRSGLLGPLEEAEGARQLTQPAEAGEETRRTAAPRQPSVCQGLLRLAAIMSTTTAGRFANAVRNLETGSPLAEANRQSCPPIYDQFGDLLPLAVEHVVAVNGEVRRPGAYPVVGDTAIAAVVAVAGGLTREVDLTRVELSRFVPDPNAGQSQATRGLVNLAKLAPEQAAVSPGDVLRFNPVFTDRDSGPVLLAGEFVRPGLYEIRRGERLSEVMARAGGLTEQAYPYGAVFTRERVKRAQQIGFRRATRELTASLVGLAAQRNVDHGSVITLQRLVRDFEGVEALGRIVIEADPTVLQVRPDLDSVLEPGDRVFMPKRPNFVAIIGDVLNPGALQFQPGVTADAYIRQAGGYQATADEDRVFVVLPNGAADPLSINPWNFTPTRIPPGSTIVVPKDPTPFTLLTLVREGSTLISQLAVTAASLAVISRD